MEARDVVHALHEARMLPSPSGDTSRRCSAKAMAVETTLKLRLVEAIGSSSWPSTFFALSKTTKMLSLAAFAAAEDEG